MAGRRCGCNGPAIFRRCFALAVVLSGAARALDDPPRELAALPADLTELSLEQLLNVEVTSVSKRAEPASSAAAALAVVTGEEIRRSGVRSIAEALRLLPGVEVARVNVHTYAVSIRGFNNPNADKLEVLLDGRSVYTPLTSQVFWEVLDTWLPDIDRIEVIRGPGAALYGANAVNGVINIITRNSATTQGLDAEAYGGNEERYGVGARYGTRLGKTASLRVYAKALNRDNSVLADGDPASDAQRTQQAGFRSDWNLTPADAFTASADIYRDRSGGMNVFGDTASDTHIDGGNLILRYGRNAGADGGLSLQGYFDGYHIDEPTIYSERRQTFGFDYQQQWTLGARNTLLYGAGLKNSRDHTGGPPDAVLFDPASRTLITYNGFLQDQINFFDGAGTLTLGSKFEHNSFTGFEVQPSARFGYRFSEALFSWAAVSRAVRTPNRLDSDIAIFCPPPNGFPGVCAPGTFRFGNPDLDSEKLIAYEWGARLRTGESLSFDLATFYDDYHKLRSVEPTAPLGSFANKLRGRGYGGELAALWQPGREVSLRAWYSFLGLDLERSHGGADLVTPTQVRGRSPRHQVGLRLAWDPAPRWDLDLHARYVGKLDADRVPEYVELGLRAAYRVTPELELAVVGENLLHDHHPEFGAPATRSELQRSGFLQLIWSAR